MIKQSTVKEIADGILSFLRKNNLEESLPQVIEYLQLNSGDNSVIVHTPRSLADREKDKLKNLIVKLVGGIPGKIDYVKDEDLIDGLKIIYKDKMWDFSVKGQIGKLAKV